LKLFSEKEVNVFLKEKIKKLENEIEKFSDEKITTIDFEEWINYFISKYEILPIKVYKDNKEMDISEVKIKSYNTWHKNDYNEPKYFNKDGYKIEFKIPYDGDDDLFNLKPSCFILRIFEVESITPPFGEKLGYLSYTMSYSKNELLNKNKKDIKKVVISKFESEFSSYMSMFENINNDIVPYNNDLPKKIRDLLTTRKEKANEFTMVCEALNIDLKMDENSPNIKPIKLKKVQRTIVERPKNKKVDPEYCISEKDFSNILNIIHNTCSSMEITAKTFIKNDEEELRDFIIATLGTHYINCVSGETFRKVGKTDIHIVFENKAAFIGECKIWHGIKKISEAMKQVFGYSTWKDNKIALIIFNKDNKDFNAIMSSIEKWIGENTKKCCKENSNMWRCTIHRKDTNVDVEIAILMYDITI